MSKKKTWKKPKIKEITDEIHPWDLLYGEDLESMEDMLGEKGVDYAQGGIVKIKKKKKKMKKPRGVGVALRGFGKACS